MEPVTQVALVGVAGTVLGALVGAGGAVAFWINQGMPEHMREFDQWNGRLEDQFLTERALERFASACRRVLHPKEHQPVRRYLGGRLARWLVR
ncbi:hypothetical protein [Actinacidiphila glaucinigra]